MKLYHYRHEAPGKRIWRGEKTAGPNDIRNESVNLSSGSMTLLLRNEEYAKDECIKVRRMMGEEDPWIPLA
jgi:hypothetical protein